MIICTCTNAVFVKCDRCKEMLMLKHWQDARKLGWIVPNDGAFQYCPKCNEARTKKMFQEAKLSKIADECPLVNDTEQQDSRLRKLCNHLNR